MTKIKRHAPKVHSTFYKRDFYDYGNRYVDAKTGKKYLPVDFPTGDLQSKENYDFEKSLDRESKHMTKMKKKYKNRKFSKEELCC
jgi:hypothetical protein